MVDDASKVRTLTYLVWKNRDGVISQDGVEVVAKPGTAPGTYVPVKYTNWLWAGDDGTITVGEFGKDLSVTKKDLSTGKVILEDTGHMAIPAGSIFASMASQIFAESNPAKYVAGGKASYIAYSEEDAKFSDLELNILESKEFSGEKIFQVTSDMLSDLIEAFTFADGQVLASRDDVNDEEVFLVSRREEAFGEFKPAATIKKIFGELPRGLRNPVAENPGKLNAKDIMRSFLSPRARKNQPLKKAH
jgi:hypothetical protein